MRRLLSAIFPLAALLCLSTAIAADVKVKQKVTMGRQQSMESTKMIKGSRERTETKIEVQGMNADFMPQIATITQCDLRRTVKLNDRKQLYLIEPFATADTSARPTRPAATEPRDTTTRTRTGGTMTMTYSIRDTGERKQMFGLTARHLIITQEMESSPDSCNGPSKMKMEFDGWYVDFSAEFNCPIDVPPSIPQGPSSKPDCIDRIVTKSTGSGKLGFLLHGTMTMYDKDGKVTMTQTTETIELSRAPLPAELFDVPKDYRQASNSQELYAMPSMADIMRDTRNNRRSDDGDDSDDSSASKPRRSAPAAKLVNVRVTYDSSVKADQGEIDRYIKNELRSRGYDPDGGANAEYTLTVNFAKLKESAAGKIGGIFGKVTGVDAKLGKVDVDMTASITSSAAPRPRQTKVAQKFDGSAMEAARAAIERAFEDILN